MRVTGISGEASYFWRAKPEAVRKIWSDRYGLTVHLCWMDHQDSREGVHHNREKMRKLQKIGQQAFEQTYPGKDFRQIFGRNYLEGGSRSLKGKE